VTAAKNHTDGALSPPRVCRRTQIFSLSLFSVVSTMMRLTSFPLPRTDRPRAELDNKTLALRSRPGPGGREVPRLLRVGLLIHVCSSISQVELNTCLMLALALHTDNPALPVCSVAFSLPV
jgi:hypothetical protein